jgi:hypothetical protein
MGVNIEYGLLGRFRRKRQGIKKHFERKIIESIAVDMRLREIYDLAYVIRAFHWLIPSRRWFSWF